MTHRMKSTNKHLLMIWISFTFGAFCFGESLAQAPNSAGETIRTSKAQVGQRPDRQDKKMGEATATGGVEVIIPKLVPGTDAMIVFNFGIAPGKLSYLNAWIDWNNDSHWSESEQIVLDKPVTRGKESLRISVPIGAKVGFAQARFRLYNRPLLGMVEQERPDPLNDNYVFLDMPRRILADAGKRKAPATGVVSQNWTPEPADAQSANQK